MDGFGVPVSLSWRTGVSRHGDAVTAGAYAQVEVGAVAGLGVR